MVYKVIGLMSGSSLDGLDIALVTLTEIRGKWSFEMTHADCVPYPREWASRLRDAANHNVPEFLRLHTAYGRYLGECVNAFIAQTGAEMQVQFIASHGHTVLHEPLNNTTFQLGDGATIAAVTGIPVISDLRGMDVALGGQGAPIVPIGDRLLFADYDFLLNIGGIANLTAQPGGQQPVAFDVCPANQVLNALAAREGEDMDKDGAMAARGTFLPGVFDALNSAAWYSRQPPKSLSNDAAIALAFPSLLESDHANYDLLRTFTGHIIYQVARSVRSYTTGGQQYKMLVTGGGAFNSFLVEHLRQELLPSGVEVVVPAPGVVKFKEALVMALIGTLRWREENNVLSSVTGSVRDSIGGAVWLV